MSARAHPPALAGARLPTLAATRLHLRHVEDGDLDDLFALYGHPEVARYTSRPPLPDLDAAREYLASLRARHEGGDAYHWAVARAGDDRLIGSVALFELD